MQRIGLWKQRDLHGAEILLEKASDFDSRLNASRLRQDQDLNIQDQDQDQDS